MESFHHHFQQESYMRKLGLKPVPKSGKSKFLQKDCSLLCKSPVVVIEPITRNLQYPTLWQLRPAFRNYHAAIEFSSKLGQKITSELQRKNNVDTSAYSVIGLEKCERYCCLNYQASETVPNLRDRTTLVKFPLTYNSSKHLTTSRTYQFNKSQKDERQKVLATGLDKRSRALKRLCKPLQIYLTPLNRKQIDKYTAYKRVNGTQLETKIHSGDSLSSQNRSTSIVNRCYVNVKLDPNLRNSFSSSKHYSVGKEIKIDGKLVIDLTSDEEPDEVKLVPQQLTLKYKKGREVCIAENQCSKKVNHLCKTTFKRSSNSGVLWENCGKSFNSSRAAKLDHCYATNSLTDSSKMKIYPHCKHSLNSNETNTNIKCAVMLEDVTNLLKKGPNGDLLVSGTGIKVSQNYFSDSSLFPNSFLKIKDSEVLKEKYSSRKEEKYFGELETFQFAHSIFQNFMQSSKNSKESLLPMIKEKSTETSVKHITNISKIKTNRKRSSESLEVTETIDLNLKVKRRREMNLSSENFDIIDNYNEDENSSEMGRLNQKTNLKCTKQFFPCADISNNSDHEKYEDFNSKLKMVNHQNLDEFALTAEHIQKSFTFHCSQKINILEDISQKKRINYLDPNLDCRNNGGYKKLNNSRKLWTDKKLLDSPGTQDYTCLRKGSPKSINGMECDSGSPVTVFICHECQIRKTLNHNVQEHINFHLKFSHNNTKVKLQRSVNKQNIVHLEAFPEKTWPIPVH